MQTPGTTVGVTIQTTVPGTQPTVPTLPPITLPPITNPPVTYPPATVPTVTTQPPLITLPPSTFYHFVLDDFHLPWEVQTLIETSQEMC